MGRRAKNPVDGASAIQPDAQPRGAKDPRLGRTHDRILEAYGEIEVGTPADRVLRSVFKRARDLGSRERAEVSDVVYGLVRARRAVDDQLSRALKAEGRNKALLDPPIVQRLQVLAYLARRGTPVADLAARDPYAFKRTPGVIERIAAGRLPAVKRGAIEELGLEVSLPDWIVERLVSSFGAEKTRELGRALDMRAPVTLRVNTLVSSVDRVRERIALEHGIDAEPARHSPIGLILPGPADVYGWPLYDEGAIELQDEGSQLVALATGAAPKQVVLDACAGAGGKTLALAAMTGNTGRVIALDPEGKKLEELRRRARRAGVTCIETVEGELEALAGKYRDSADRVLLDAPCTGTGAFRRHPDARWRVTERELEEHVTRQRRLLASAVGAAKIGGFVVYATCSVLFEEDEGVFEELAKIDGRVEPASFRAVAGAAAANAIAANPDASSARIGPGPDDRGPDGFFLAALRRRS